MRPLRRKSRVILGLFRKMWYDKDKLERSAGKRSCDTRADMKWEGGRPMAMELGRAALELVDPRLENAARTLGASEWKVFWQVSLPLAWRGIVAGGMLAFARGMGEFGATLMIAGNIPGKTQTLALAIYDAFQAGNDEQATVLVVLTSCLCLTILVLADRLFGGKAGGR